MSEDWKDSAKLLWNEESELKDPEVKSVILAVNGSKHGSADPALRLRDSESQYMRLRFNIAFCNPS